MPKRKDENQTDFSTLQELMRRDAERNCVDYKPVDPTIKSPAAVKAGQLHGHKGGQARAARLTPRKRKAIAKKAARHPLAEVIT